MEHLALLQEAVQFWQSRASRHLTTEDARQAIENITGFFETLERWDSTKSAESTDDVETP